MIVLLLAFSILAVSAEDLATDDAVYQDGSDGVKDVWIDQTVDESMIYINGEMKVIDRAAHSEHVFVLSNSTPATFSKIDSKDIEMQTVKNAENHAKEVLKPKNFRLVAGTSTNTTKVYDNRKYETIEEGDAVIIGDASYYGDLSSDPDTRTHIAQGGYAKILNVTLNLIYECNYDETEDAPVEPAADNTTNDTAADNATNSTQNSAAADNAADTTNNTVNSEKNIPKKTNMVENTGIPFAVLIVAILGLGVSLRRR